MRAGWTRQLDQSLRGLLPFLVGLLLLFVMMAPWRLPGIGPIMPQLLLIAVFYWSIYRPDKLPYTASFVLGLTQDLLSGNPAGLSALVLLAVQVVVLNQRRFFVGKSFLVAWWGFSLMAAAAALLSWLAGSAFYGALLPPAPLAVQSVLTILFYPPVSWLLARVQALMGAPA